MIRRLAALFGALLLAWALMPASEAAGKRTAPARAAAAPVDPFPQSEAVLRFIHGYRHAPEPKRLAEAVSAMRRHGLFRDQEAAGLYIGFIAGVLGEAGAAADDLIAGLFPIPPPEQVIVIKAIAYSGRADWKELLGRFNERMPARRVLIERYLYDKTPVLAQVPMDTGPAALDALWGLYFATGSPEPVMRMISVLPWSKERSDIERLTIGSMVKWTLATNAERDPDLLRLLKTLLPFEGPATQPLLAAVIEAVETSEISRLRKDAVEAIEDARRRAPPKKPEGATAWWAQAAPTLISLGCVAAAATGHVEFGLPCVIGGPLATAAIKHYGPQ